MTERALTRYTHLEYTEAWHYYLTELKLCYQIRHTCQFPLGVFPIETLVTCAPNNVLQERLKARDTAPSVFV